MKNLLPLLFIIIFNQAFAQVTFSGKVTDEKGVPVTGANVYLKDTYDGATTDINGDFNFSTREKGQQILTVSFIGYHEKTHEVDADKGQHDITISLKESINQLNAVVITAGSFTAGEEANREVLKPMDIVTTAGATADIAGVLNTLPGTQTVGETGRLFVRGGEGYETKTFIDGNEVLHAYSSSAPNTPGRGRFSPFMFSGTSFSTGGYSAEYGQALSSALILKSKDVPAQTRTDFSLMTVGGGVAHTQKLNDGALLAGFNYTNLTPYFKAVEQKIEWEKAPTSYQGDIIFRQKLQNDDIFKFYANINTSSFEIYEPSIQNDLQKDKIGLANDYYYLNSTYKKIINDSWSLLSGISFTSFEENVKINSNSYDEKENSLHIKTVAANDISEKVALIFGAEHFSSGYSFQYNDVAQGTLNYEKGLTAFFAEADLYASNKFVTRVGVRSEYNGLQEKFYVTPRISLAYKVDENSQMSLAYGQFNQTGSNELVRMRTDLKDEQAAHYILNYQRDVEGRTFRIEGYYKNYNDLIKFDGNNPYNPLGYNNNGSGYAQGFDIFWRDNASVSGLDYWVSYSFLDTERDYRDFPQQAIPVFASKHNFSVVGKYFVQSIKTQIGATYSFTSPRPYHDPNKAGFNNSFTKAYHDLSVNFSYLLASNIILHTSVTNVLGIKNVFGYEANTEPDEAGNYTLKPITPAAPRFIFLGVFITLSKEKALNQLPNL